MHFYYIYVIISLEKSLVIILKCLVDYVIQNNDEVIDKKNIKANYIENKKLSFIDNNESINITTNENNIIMQKENEDSNIIFDFTLNKKTNSKYYIKQIDSYLNMTVLTKKLIIEKNQYEVEYELWIEEENIGKFKYKLKIKEM